MQKVFALLLAEFRKLGATIIFANFSKLIIDTGKYELSAAQAYCDSLLSTIQNRLVAGISISLWLLALRCLHNTVFTDV